MCRESSALILPLVCWTWSGEDPTLSLPPCLLPRQLAHLPSHIRRADRQSWKENYFYYCFSSSSLVYMPLSVSLGCAAHLPQHCQILIFKLHLSATLNLACFSQMTNAHYRTQSQMLWTRQGLQSACWLGVFMVVHCEFCFSRCWGWGWGRQAFFRKDLHLWEMSVPQGKGGGEFNLEETLFVGGSFLCASERPL